eukprot:g995.t1
MTEHVVRTKQTNRIDAQFYRKIHCPFLQQKDLSFLSFFAADDTKMVKRCQSDAIRREVLARSMVGMHEIGEQKRSGVIWLVLLAGALCWWLAAATSDPNSDSDSPRRPQRPGDHASLPTGAHGSSRWLGTGAHGARWLVTGCQDGLPNGHPMPQNTPESACCTRFELGTSSWVEQHCELPESLQLNSLAEFERLWELRPQELGTFMLMGKLRNVPRYEKNFGEVYTYGGVEHAAAPVPAVLQPYLNWVEKREGHKYAQLLVNWYDGPDHSMGKHADDERELDLSVSIYSFSFHTGPVPRRFQVYPKQGGARVLDLPMPHNSLLVMGGDMQRQYKHAVPKMTAGERKRVLMADTKSPVACSKTEPGLPLSSAQPRPRRINITLRAYRTTPLQERKGKIFAAFAFGREECSTLPLVNILFIIYATTRMPAHMPHWRYQCRNQNGQQVEAGPREDNIN